MSNVGWGSDSVDVGYSPFEHQVIWCQSGPKSRLIERMSGFYWQFVHPLCQYHRHCQVITHSQMHVPILRVQPTRVRCCRQWKWMKHGNVSVCRNIPENTHDNYVENFKFRYSQYSSGILTCVNAALWILRIQSDNLMPHMPFESQLLKRPSRRVQYPTNWMVVILGLLCRLILCKQVVFVRNYIWNSCMNVCY